MIGTQISQYKLVEKLGEGGMGVVYKAIDTLLDRVVAIKLISAERAENDEILQRFKSEAKMQATLSHVNIAILYSYLVWEGRAVIVMEYIEGETLQQMIARRGPIPADVALPLFKQALLGVGAAHRRGIVHRDIKPANIMVNADAVVKVMDFGIAKDLGVTGTTRTNLQMGSVWYMAPEQVLSRPVDARTDIYALGVTLYELLSGQVPFRADSEYEVLNSHLQREPVLPTVHYPHIPRACVAAIMRALAKEPEKRFASTEDFCEAIEQCDPETPEGTTAAVLPVPVQAPASAVSVFPGSASQLQPGYPTVVEERPPAKPRSGLPLVLVAALVLVVGAAGLFFYAMRERDRRSEMASHTTAAGPRRTAGMSDEERRMQAEQDQAAAELTKQLAAQGAATTSGSGGAGSGGQPGSQGRSGTEAKADPPPAATPRTQGPAAQAPPPSGAGTLAPPVSSGPFEAGRLHALTGTWTGSYTCTQGTTGATLQILASSDQDVGALLQFAVPNSAPGAYFLRGTFNPESNRVAMNFTRWKYQPPGYNPGNVSGVVDFARGEIHGNLVLPGCAGLSLHKQ